MKKTLLPGSTLGVMGGGQLGRMFVQAAQRMGYLTAVLDADPASPAGLIAHHHVQTDYLDEQGLAQMAQRCDGITTEFENVPAGSLASLGQHLPVSPGAEAVLICQDRAKEKAHFQACGVPCAPWAPIESEADLAAVPDALLPGLLKTARLGYDGKGQQTAQSREDLARAWRALGALPCVLEQRQQLALELSVVVARNRAGDLVHLPVLQNLHRDGILAVTRMPAPDVAPALAAQAIDAAHTLAQTMHYVGVLCVEFFVLQDGRLLANEMAPRPHNSGHASMDALDLSQFDLQVRALAGLPLLVPRQHSPAIMLNLLGDLWLQQPGATVEPNWAKVLALPGAHLHLYGKVAARPGRKMGHLNITAATAEQAQAIARQAAAALALPAL